MEEDTFEDEDTQAEDTAEDEKEAEEASVASEGTECDPDVSNCGEKEIVVPDDGRRLESLLNQN